MLVRSLEIQGFKTFPDKTVLQFHDGITAVVGPNGSGKSNISDAVRWVLGEQNVRTLRCTKMEDVIFNGTPQRKPLGYAEVTLNIDNRSRRIPFDKDDVSVTRRYYRSGESEYLLNKVSVRLRDINELFMDTGLGRDGYSIIGQGKIDAIVSAKSEDRREIFEEAAGISRYRYRKEDSERKLDAAEENLVRLRDILAELESRVGPLKEQSGKAEKFLNYSAEKKSLEIALWLRQLDQSAAVLHQYDDKITLARTQQESAQRELAALDKMTEKNFQGITSCASEIDKIRQRSASCEESAARKDGEADVLLNDAHHAEETVRRLKNEQTSAVDSGERIRTEIQGKEQQAAEHTDKVSTYRQEIDADNQKLETLRTSMNSASAQADDFSQQLAKLTAAATEYKVKEMTAASAIREIGLQVSQADDKISEREGLLAQLKESKNASEKMLAEMETHIQDLQNTERGYELRLQSHRKKSEEMKQEADRLLLDAKESFRRVGLLEALERNMEGFSKSVKAVMQESRRGTLPGICGPVSRLITVPDQYAVAMETALGAAMQHIAVNTEEDAKRAISLLKHRNSGRATFLPLNTIRGRVLQEKGLLDCSGFIGIASELCSSEEKYRPVLENLLGRIAVAENLDSAVEIARKFGYHFRVVTLDGQVVNAGGSLTGGSRAYNSGLLSRRSEIEKIRDTAQAQQAKADKAAEALKHCQQEATRDEAELATARAEHSAAKEDRIHMVADREQLLKDLAGVEQDVGNLHAEKDTFSARLAEQTVLQDDAHRHAVQTAEQIQAAQNQAEALSGNRTELNRQCDEQNAKIQELRLQMLSVQKDCENISTALQELHNRMRDTTERNTALQGEIQQEEQKAAGLKQQAVQVRTQAENLRQEAKMCTDNVGKVNAHRMELEQQSTQLRQKQKAKESEKENIGHELARLEERQENLKQQHDGISSKLWEEYELTRREAEPLAAKIEDVKQTQLRLNELKGLIRALGSVNVAAIEEYKEVSGRYEFLSAQIQDVETSRGELRRLISSLTDQMREQFQQSFTSIRSNFTATFRELFGGGTATLELTNPEDILTSGIDISVQPPGKIVSHLESLSGGEKALVAIALYFAIMKESPPPFCMLDEIEAALDDMNVTRFANYLRRMAENTQFIVITHRRGSMEEADVLYGVTMQDEGISQILELHPDEIAKYH
jgi:chromosome segregation protein